MPSKVMTISRICVLLWFTIFFETVRTTTPSTFTDADTSPLATESVTTASTFTDADTSPYATDNRTENVTMATDLPATTISNNRTENVTMATDLPATTISNNTTENMTMATDLPATTIPNNATENMTMATDLPATTIPNNTTENVTMATDLPATTISKNTTENVTMATDFPATTLSNNTIENVTMATVSPATTISTYTTELSTITPTTETHVTTTKPSKDSNLDINIIILYILVGGMVGVMIFYYLNLKCCKSEKKNFKFLGDRKTIFTEISNNSPTGRISRVELWKMVEYATRSHEEDKLDEVISSLTKDGSYGSIRKTLRGANSKEESDYQKLVSWKEKYNGATLMEIYRIGFEAGMRETLKKLQVFRGNVSNTVSSTDLEHVLWQIGGKSRDNISHLLHTLGVDPRMNRRASLKEMVNEARDRLQTWQEGYVSINPFAMLSLALEEFQISPLEEFFQVPENKKKSLEEAEIKKYVCDATMRHCKRILEVIRSEGGDAVIGISKTLEENNKALFNTYRMVEDWLKEQETSDYEKRRALEDAIKIVKISEPDDGKDLFSATVIRKKVSKSEKHRCDLKVKAAWELLMTDIQPFAEAIGIDESKLTDYKAAFQTSHLKMGTVGLVSKLVD